MSQQYDNTNTGALFMNDKAGNDKRPDRKGTINVEGVEYQLSGWIREKKNGGEKFLSLKIERKDSQGGKQWNDRPASDAMRKPATLSKNDSGWIDNDDSPPPF
jgi:hypothetical protein